MTHRHGPLLLLAVVVEASLISLYGLKTNPSLHVAGFITAYLTAFLSYLVSCYLVINKGQTDLGRTGMRLIWGMAILFRLTVLPLDPQLSEDLHRYRWDGKLQAAGGNPYTEAPESPSWKHLRDGGYPQVAGKQLPTVYGPVLEIVYAGTYVVTATVSEDPLWQARLFKIPFALVELGVGWTLAGILCALGKPSSWLLIYLWSPLIVTEFWAQGHNDPLVMLFVVLTLGAIVRCRWHRAWCWLTVAALTKLWPLLLAPLFLLRNKDDNPRLSGKVMISSLVLVFLFALPYWDGILRIGETLLAFADGRQNNAALYALILAISGGNYGLTTAITAGFLIVIIVILTTLRLEIIQGMMAVVVALLLLSANCFPWYLGWLVPFLVIYPSVGLLLWTGLVPLSYHILIDYTILGIWRESYEFQILEYVPVYAILLSNICALRCRPQRVFGRLVERSPPDFRAG